MNLLDHEEELYAVFGYETTPTPEVVNRFRRFLNVAYRETMASKGFSKLRRKTTTFTNIANVDLVSLPQAATRIVTIQDRVNQWTLDEVDLQDVRFDDPGEVLQSTFPYEYVLMNYAASTVREPTAPAELFVRSTSASDTTGITAYLEGIVTGGFERSASIPLNGVTAVSLNPLITTWTDIKRFYLNSVATGEIVLTQTSGAGTELSRIPPGRKYSRFTRILLHPTPSQVNTYFTDVELALSDLVQPTDETLLPEDYQWIISAKAAMREWQKRKDPISYSQDLARVRDGMAELKMHLQKRGDIPQQTTRGRRFSQLGSYFPAGS